MFIYTGHNAHIPLLLVVQDWDGDGTDYLFLCATVHLQMHKTENIGVTGAHDKTIYRTCSFS